MSCVVTCAFLSRSSRTAFPCRMHSALSCLQMVTMNCVNCRSHILCAIVTCAAPPQYTAHLQVCY
jgi:hypothetical protein